jgi:hypothetical protein
MNTWTKERDPITALYDDYSIHFSDDYHAGFYIWLDDIRDFGKATVDIVVFDNGGYGQAVIDRKTLTITDRKKATIEGIKRIVESMNPRRKELCTTNQYLSQ